MKKILTTFLISLTLLTFSNTASASFFGDIFKDIFGDFGEPADKNPFGEKHGDVIEARCKVEYTQLDLATGLEKNIKYTADQETMYTARGSNTMYLATQDLTDKVNNWLDENPNNIIVNMTGINCKEKNAIIPVFNVARVGASWGEYKSCEDKYNIEFMNLLDYPNRWGYNVNIERLIKDYDEGCRTLYGDYSDG
jgi:hypothetical protein